MVKSIVRTKHVAFLALILLLPWLSACTESGAMPITMLGGGVTAAVGSTVDNCPDATYEMAYNGDCTSGADYVCYESGSDSEQGATQDATVSTSDVQFSAQDDWLKFTVTGDFTSGLGDEGTLFLTVYFTNEGDADVEENAVIEYWNDASNFVEVYVDTNGKMGGMHRGGGGSLQLVQTGFGSIGNDTWYRCGYSWQIGADTGGVHSIKCAAQQTALADWSSEVEEIEDLDTWPDDADTFAIGEENRSRAVNDIPVHVKDIFLLTGYQSADPL